MLLLTRKQVERRRYFVPSQVHNGSQWDQYLLLHNHWVPQRRRRGDLGRRLGQVDCAHSNGDTGSDL